MYSYTQISDILLVYNYTPYFGVYLYTKDSGAVWCISMHQKLVYSYTPDMICDAVNTYTRDSDRFCVYLYTGSAIRDVCNYTQE